MRLLLVFTTMYMLRGSQKYRRAIHDADHPRSIVTMMIALYHHTPTDPFLSPWHDIKSLSL